MIHPHKHKRIYILILPHIYKVVKSIQVCPRRYTVQYLYPNTSSKEGRYSLFLSTHAHFQFSFNQPLIFSLNTKSPTYFHFPFNPFLLFPISFIHSTYFSILKINHHCSMLFNFVFSSNFFFFFFFLQLDHIKYPFQYHHLLTPSHTPTTYFTPLCHSQFTLYLCLFSSLVRGHLLLQLFYNTVNVSSPCILILAIISTSHAEQPPFVSSRLYL